MACAVRACRRSGRRFAACTRRDRPRATDKRRLDEVVVAIDGVNHRLRRAIDDSHPAVAEAKHEVADARKPMGRRLLNDHRAAAKDASRAVRAGSRERPGEPRRDGRIPRNKTIRRAMKKMVDYVASPQARLANHAERHRAGVRAVRPRSLRAAPITRQAPARFAHSICAGRSAAPSTSFRFAPLTSTSAAPRSRAPPDAPKLGELPCVIAQNRKYRCAIGSTVAGSQVRSAPSARTS